MTIGERGVVWDFCRKCHCVTIHCFERLTVPRKCYIMHLFCAFWCKYFCVYVFCWQIQSNEMQRLFKCEFLSVPAPQMFFTFSVAVFFSYLSNAFMLKNSCLLLLLKLFANVLRVFFLWRHNQLLVRVQVIIKIITYLPTINLFLFYVLENWGINVGKGYVQIYLTSK